MAHAGFTPNGQMVSDEPTATDMFTGDFFAQGEEQDSTAMFSDGTQLPASEETLAQDSAETAETAVEETTEDSAEPTEQ